jgi:hypothetical protein
MAMKRTKVYSRDEELVQGAVPLAQIEEDELHLADEGHQDHEGREGADVLELFHAQDIGHDGYQERTGGQTQEEQVKSDP